ncbi:hypothetical protein NQZ68_007670 [Dissostichus eleginoides]|nr:hypothetical protein NQZ68_007670 [Dissostichus eleginoides]
MLPFFRIMPVSMKQSKAPKNLQMMNPGMRYILCSSSKTFLRRGEQMNRRIVFTDGISCRFEFSSVSQCCGALIVSPDSVQHFTKTSSFLLSIFV